jgi:hypothetical protein
VPHGFLQVFETVPTLYLPCISQEAAKTLLEELKNARESLLKTSITLRQIQRLQRIRPAI